jgi:outer membrane biosynthesis protein TonB
VSNDRIILVGIVWSLALLGLLVLREFLKAGRWHGSARVLRTLNILVAVMIAAFSLAAVVRLASLTGGPGASPSPSGLVAVATPTQPPTPPGATLPPLPTTPVVTLAPTPTLVSPTPIPTPALPTPPLPTVTPQPTVAPTPTPIPTAPPSPSPTPAQGGEVAVGTTFTEYTVRDGVVIGSHKRHVSAAFTARCSAPTDYPEPTLSDPIGHVLLVHLESGPWAGIYVSPDDPGVSYTPG